MNQIWLYTVEFCSRMMPKIKQNMHSEQYKQQQQISKAFFHGYFKRIKEMFPKNEIFFTCPGIEPDANAICNNQMQTD